jgi:hypothetical protein
MKDDLHLFLTLSGVTEMIFKPPAQRTFFDGKSIRQEQDRGKEKSKSKTFYRLMKAWSIRGHKAPS